VVVVAAAEPMVVAVLAAPAVVVQLFLLTQAQLRNLQVVM
jgi:hypothetical protein